jgi:hypothetical protein
MPKECTCPTPADGLLPAGWHWCVFEKRVVTDGGTQVPLADHPLIGNEEEQEAYRTLRAWESQRRGASARVTTITNEGGADAATDDSSLHG